MFKKMKFIKKLLVIKAVILVLASTAVSFNYWIHNVSEPAADSGTIQVTPGAVEIGTSLSITDVEITTANTLVPALDGDAKVTGTTTAPTITITYTWSADQDFINDENYTGVPTVTITSAHNEFLNVTLVTVSPVATLEVGNTLEVTFEFINETVLTEAHYNLVSGTPITLQLSIGSIQDTTT